MTGFTVGVEEEYQLVDAASGDLRSEARAVLGADWTGELKHEMQESTIEIGTRVCANGEALREEMVRLRFQTATVAASRDLAIIAAGVHPLSRWEVHELSTGPRYRRIAREYGRLAREEHNFGMHVHVAVPDGHDRIQVMGMARTYLPHLLALSCSSPYYEGEDTGYASFRSILWRRWPRTGPPPSFADEAQYQRYVEALTRAGAIQDGRDIYWMMRPHPTYPTLEFRVCDACPSIDDALAIACLARVIVAAAARGVLPTPGLGPDPALTEPIVQEDLWHVARDGLNAQLVRPEAPGGAGNVRAELRELLAELRPVAADLEESRMEAAVTAILARGNGAERMRAHQEQSPSRRELIGWLAEETLVSTGIDRRRGQRPARSEAES